MCRKMITFLEEKRSILYAYIMITVQLSLSQSHRFDITSCLTVLFPYWSFLPVQLLWNIKWILFLNFSLLSFLKLLISPPQFKIVPVRYFLWLTIAPTEIYLFQIIELNFRAVRCEKSPITKPGRSFRSAKYFQRRY